MTFASRLSRIFALLGATPLIVLGLLSAGDELRQFFNPCFFFADTPGGNPLPAGCHTGGGTTETKARVIIRLMLVQGTAVVAAVAGLTGAFRSRSRLVLGASLYLFALTVPLIVGSSGLITLFCALCFLASFLSTMAQSRLQARRRLIHGR
jgi:hypothetical protein